MTNYDISNQYNLYTRNYNKNYLINENNDTTYIFELILKDKLNNYYVIRRIKKSNKGEIISQTDKIYYNLFDKYKLTVMNMNDIDNPIIIKNYLKMKTFNNNDIYLEINKTSDNLMIFNYSINN
jgi:hypothetical protein